MLFLILVVVNGTILGLSAWHKGGNSVLWWAVGVSLLIVTLLMALFLPTMADALRMRARGREQEGNFFECQACGTQIRSEAALCWCCRRDAIPTPPAAMGLQSMRRLGRVPHVSARPPPGN